MQTVAVSAAGFFGLDRQHIRHLVQSSGGTYSGDLLADYTTHLVYKDLELAKRGEKYVTALSWGIPVLPFSWLQSCAECQSLLADTYMPSIAEPAVASPATKMQQLCLQVDKISAQRLPEGQADTQDRASPCAKAHQRPPDIASQVKGQHTTRDNGQVNQQLDSTEDFELLSCIGSCQPDLSDALLTQSLGASATDACRSETCSDSCTPDKIFDELQDLHVPSPPTAAVTAATAATAAAAPVLSSQSSSDEIIIPDSQPDDSTVQSVGQQWTLIMTPVNEISTTKTSFSPSTDAPGTIPDTAFDATDHLQSPAEQQVSNSPECASAGSLQDVGNMCQVSGHTSVSHAGEHASPDDQHCEAVADTELQLLSPSADTLDAVSGWWAGRSAAGRSQATASCSADAISGVHHQNAQQSLQDAKQVAQQQQKQQQQQDVSQQQVEQWQGQGQQSTLQQQAETWREQQGMLQQQQQQQQHNLLQKRSDTLHQPQQPAQSALSLADCSSQGCPGNSDASHAFVLEDSDDEGDFQPVKPSRPSTGSFHAKRTTSKLTCHR